MDQSELNTASDARDLVRELRDYLDTHGAVAKEMCLINRTMLTLAATRSVDTPPVQTWYFDGAGLAVWEMKHGFDRASPEEFIAALRNPLIAQYVGTSAEDFLAAFRAKLLEVAERIIDVGSGASKAEMEKATRTSQSRAAAMRFRDYEKSGPPKQIDLSQIADRIYVAHFAAVRAHREIYTETLDAHHGFWDRLRWLRPGNYQRHWQGCGACRADVERYLGDTKLLLDRLSLVKSFRESEENCFPCMAESQQSREEHARSCPYCTSALEVTTERLRKLLNGETGIF